MMTLTIGNSYSKISGLSPKQEKELRNLLSYTVGGSSAYFGRGFVRKKSLLSKTCEFPTGLRHRVEQWCRTQPTPHSSIMTAPSKKLRRQNKPIDFKPYKWQEEALDEALASSRGIISAPTGSGKSNVIKMICSRFEKVLVVVPTLEIKKQLSDCLKQYNAVIENIDSKALSSLKDFDCLIIDEGHHVAAKTYQKLNKTAWTNISERYFFTATPFRNDSEEQLLFESIAGQVIYKLDYHTAIREGYIVPIEAYYIESIKQKTEAYTYREVYNELVVSNESKNKQIIELLTTLHSASKSTLCLVREVKHGKMLAEITGLPFVSGEDEESRRFINQFNKGFIKVLIGTTGILGEGVDTKPCEYVIIAGLGKAKSHFMQQVGRSVRVYPGKESAKIILIQDKSHKFLNRHFKEQCAILKEEYGVTPVKL